MSVRSRYKRDLERGVIRQDRAQARVVEALNQLHEELLALPSPSLLGRILRRTPQTPGGIYLYGPVGRGKTYLVDAFFAELPFEEKRRQHFHHFMRYAHREMRRRKDAEDPLRQIAREQARHVRVLCLDEFAVNDIADAMILGRLLEALSEEGVTLVATSNEHPDELYHEGLQRQRFLPTIDFLKMNLEVLSLDGAQDYRLEFLEQADIYHVPPGEEADRILDDAFDHVAPEAGSRRSEVQVEGRRIPARRLGDGVVWFDFDALCRGPRSQNDYIEIAHCFHTVLVSSIPIMDDHTNDEARRFINLIDELYERRVNLVCSAEADAEALYQGERLAFEFRRTISRLMHMRSNEYLAERHIP